MFQPCPASPIDTDELLGQVRDTVEHAKRVMADGRGVRERFQEADRQLLATLAESRRFQDWIDWPLKR
jgi:hypothetical protein